VSIPVARYTERPAQQKARVVWDAVAAAGFTGVTLWYEALAKNPEHGESGGWFFSMGSGPNWLGPGWAEAVARARELGDTRDDRELEAASAGDSENPLDPEAVTIVRRTFGENIDLSEGTTGYHLARVVGLELAQLAELREKLFSLWVGLESADLESTDLGPPCAD
jgi:hypothetical protein